MSATWSRFFFFSFQYFYQIRWFFENEKIFAQATYNSHFLGWFQKFRVHRTNTTIDRYLCTLCEYILLAKMMREKGQSPKLDWNTKLKITKFSKNISWKSTINNFGTVCIVHNCYKHGVPFNDFLSKREIKEDEKKG